MKIIFAGTPEFACVALRALHQAGFDIPLVLSQPDRPAGRGLQIQASAVKEYALEHSLALAQPVSLRLDGRFADAAHAAHQLLRDAAPDVMVVAAYGLILPRSVLAIPRLGCINIHASLLPRWRGAAPIHRAIEAGDRETGVTIMQMEEGLDTGAILMMQSVPIRSQDTTGSLQLKLATLGGALIVEAVRKLEQGRLDATPQPEDGMTYAQKIGKDEARLDFSRPAEELDCKIRAFDPFPGAFGMFGSLALKFWRADVTAAPHGALPGQVLEAGSEGVAVACGRGALRVRELQKPGGKRLPAAEFLKGFPLGGGSFS
jgi:methionyl-tRNA formyltransferase